MSNMRLNNVIKNDKLKEIQKATLSDLSDMLKQSFGPYGSTTCIKKLNALNMYTKDGHNILSNIYYNGIVEQSIKDDVESITRHIVTTVGDGTTSAVLLSNNIFSAILDKEKNTTLANLPPAVLLRRFEKIVDEIGERIRSNAKECTVDDIYDIAMISSNGDEEVAQTMKNIYSEYGMDVFIDVAISNSTEDVLKIYDGVTINSGFADPCYINTANNEAYINDAHIYLFEDPIDTPEMGRFLDCIITNNIINPLGQQNGTIVPTVIICPRVSRDSCMCLDSLIDQYTASKPSARPPFVLITNYYDQDAVNDIAKLCGIKPIRKYIDPKNQQKDQKNGNAPTYLNVHTWFGKADAVVATSGYTKFINPSKMYDENGKPSDTYSSLIDFLEKEISVAIDNGENAGVTGALKRRLNALKANMVEYLVGGITVADRDSKRDLIEDTVKICRSAAANGVGYAANFEAYKASEKTTEDSVDNVIYTIIHNAYKDLINTLYTISNVSDIMKEKSMYQELKPINIREMTLTPNNNVVSSIESDIVILKAVSQIIGIMVTTNQFVVPTPAHNVYIDLK